MLLLHFVDGIPDHLPFGHIATPRVDLQHNRLPGTDRICLRRNLFDLLWAKVATDHSGQGKQKRRTDGQVHFAIFRR